jgi:hypothetical protein
LAENKKNEKSNTDKNIEKSFVNADADAPAPNGPVSSPSFVKDDPKEAEKSEKKVVPTMGEVLMYMAKQEHEINMKLESLIEILKILKNAHGTLIPPITTALSIPTSSQPMQQTLVPPTTVSIDQKLEKIKSTLSEYGTLLEFDSTSSNMVYLIRAKQFLGSENFAKIASIVRGLGGSYVSQGKQSHFEVSKAI